MAKLKSIIGHKNPKVKASAKDKGSLRSIYGIDRCDNAFYISETVHESLIDKGTLFEEQEMEPGVQLKIFPIDDEDQQEGAVGKSYKEALNELALVVLAPTVVQNHDFIYLMEEFNKSKFSIVAFKK